MKVEPQRLIRGHRITSVILTDEELLEIRARQRTFDGAYWRTALSAFATGLLVLKLFTKDFFYVGINFFVFGINMLVIAALRRRYAGDVFNVNEPFRTSGDFVILTTIVTLASYVVLLFQLLSL